MSVIWKKNEEGKHIATDENDKQIKGWVQDTSGKWYHLNDKDGTLDVGFYQTSTDNDFWFYSYKEQTIKDDDTHYEGEMATGWIFHNENWYYLYPQRTGNYGVTYPKGAMAVDWIKLGDKQKWYYLLKEDAVYNGKQHYKGSCVCDVTFNLYGTSYKFDVNGVWQSGGVIGDSLVSDDLVSYVAGWEGLYTTAYADPYYGASVKQYWTIGYGTCYCAIPEAFPDGLDSTCTQEQAFGWLKEEINRVANTIKDALGDSYNSISQQAFDCLCDIGYNAGTGALIGGGTWNAVISGDTDLIKTKLMAWNKANGQYSEGLNKRCLGRVNMCLNGVYDSDH